MFVVFIFGNPLINFFSSKQIHDPIREDGPQSHLIAKKGTPNSVDNPMTWYEFGEEENYLILDTEVRNDQKLERQFCDIMIEKLMQSAASE